MFQVHSSLGVTQKEWPLSVRQTPDLYDFEQIVLCVAGGSCVGATSQLVTGKVWL